MGREVNYRAGRGRGGRDARGGRGRGRSHDRRTKNTGLSMKAPEVKFFPHGYGRERQTLSYDIVKDHIMQTVQKQYKHGKDVAESLRKMTLIDIEAQMPRRMTSTETNEEQQKIEQNGFDIIFKAEVDVYIQRKAIFEDNMNKAYSLIYTTYCSKVIQDRVTAHPDFDDKIDSNPIELLRAIKILMHDPVRARYPYASVTEALGRLLNCKQLENESVNDYYKRFKGIRDGVSQHMGKEFLEQFVKNTKEYTECTMDVKKEEMIKESFARWTGYLLMKNSDQRKYGTLLNGLTTQYSMGHNQYPKDVATACDILSNHKFDNKPNKDKKWGKQKNDDDTASTLTTKSEASFAQAKTLKDTACYCCGKKGHLSDKCPEKDKRKKEDWAIKKAMLYVQSESEKETDEQDDDDSSQASTRSSKNTSKNWAHLSIRKESLLNKGESWATGMKKNSIILDNGSTLSLFANPDMVENIRKSNTTLELATNAGISTSNQIADVPGYGTVWFDEKAIANIFGLSDLKKKYRVTYDSDKEDAFIVHMENGKTVEFKCNPDGLYHHEVSQDFVSKESHLISTVNENRMGYTQRQFDRAKTARELYHIVGAPTVENFKALLRMNAIKNCPVTAEDVTISEKIFGTDMSTLKGKSTRKKPTPVREDIIEIPKELITQHRDVELCIDIMYVNECGMMTTIDRTIKFRAVLPMGNKTHEEYYGALDKVLRLYNEAGFVIKTIHCDGEFRAMMNRVKDDLGVRMNFTNALDHVPEAERNNRTIKERIRAAFHRLPYKAIPRLMIRYLAMTQAAQLNLFPVKGGISPYYSPRNLLGLPSLDYTRHCTIPFGAFVQANHENKQTNSNAPRTLDAIYLRPAYNMQGGHELMDLSSGKLITRARVKQLPVTDLVIKAVEAMAYTQGFKSLKFRNRHGHTIHDADWIAGVDYEPTDEQEDNEDEDDEAYTQDEDDNEDNEDEDEQYDRIDEDEIDDLHAEIARETNPNQHNEPDTNEQAQEQHEHGDGTMISDAETESETSQPRRSNRDTRPVERLQPRMSGKSYIQEDKKSQTRKKKVRFMEDDLRQLEYCHNLVSQTKPDRDQTLEYTQGQAMLIARLMKDISTQVSIHGASFAQQYLLKQGLKVFGQRGQRASMKEIDQLHKRTCFAPLSVKEMTSTERRKAQLALMFLTEKRDESIKGRLVYNGKPTREWLSREDAASPTAALESIMITGVIEAKEERDVMSNDIPNAFIQAYIPTKQPGEDRVVMKITGMLVDMLIEIDPEKYASAVVLENKKKVLYVQVLKAIYGMLEAALLWYKKFRKDLEKIGFKFNPYDPCVANRMIKGSQQTVLFHVDDLKSSHKLKSVNDEFEKWLNKMYGKHGKVTAHRGMKHDYLGMELDYSTKGELHVGMCKYVSNMCDEFPIKITAKDTAKTPAGDNLFEEGSSAKLDSKRAEIFHTWVAKALFLCKRARPDIQQAVSVLCTRTKSPNQSDWTKLIRMMKYLNGTRHLKLRLKVNDIRVIKWYVDASFGVHPDFKSHTGAVMTMGKGAIQSIARKQKLNTRSSTESELVAVDDAATMVLWTKLFLEAQGYEINKNVIYQDNKSAILLETNGRRSAGKRSRALNIRYFFVTDQVKKGNAEIEYCPTDDMVGDFFTKPLQGDKFIRFRDTILGQ